MLAVPLRVPKYTVTPMPRSRWYSTVSTSPSRAETLSPTSMLTAASAWRGAERARFGEREFDQGEQVRAIGGQGRRTVGRAMLRRIQDSGCGDSSSGRGLACPRASMILRRAR